METAKGTDLPDLLEHLGYTVRRLGRRCPSFEDRQTPAADLYGRWAGQRRLSPSEMDSIRIKERRTWKRYSNGTGGDAITFLQEFFGTELFLLRLRDILHGLPLRCLQRLLDQSQPPRGQICRTCWSAWATASAG